MKELFGSLENMVADKDAQLSALTNELEISQKELCEDKLSGLTRELETLQ